MGQLTNWSDILQAIASVSLGLIAFLGYRFQKQQKSDAWYRSFRSLYCKFWESESIKEVRSWIACDLAYAEKIQPVLAKRLVSGVSAEEYELLEKIDYFCSVLVQITQLNPEKSNKEQKRYYVELYDRYWVRCLKQRRELWSYIGKFWPTLRRGIERLPMELQ